MHSSFAVPVSSSEHLMGNAAQALPYKVDFKCEWDLPMYCDLNLADKGGAGTSGQPNQNKKGDPEPYADQKYLQSMPDVGFFKKIK